MLGQLDLAHGMYSAETLKVSGDLDTTAIAQEIAVLGHQIALAAPAITLDAPAPSSTRHVAAVAAPEGLWDGHLLARPDGSFAEVKDGLQEPVSVPRTAGGELRLLLDLRDSARALLTAEAHTLEDTPSLEQLRARLRESTTPTTRATARSTGSRCSAPAAPTPRRARRSCAASRRGRSPRCGATRSRRW